MYCILVWFTSLLVLCVRGWLDDQNRVQTGPAALRHQCIQHNIGNECWGMRAQLDDQGLVQTDPRNIAVPDGFVNNIPTDIRGLTFSRTPQMVRSCPQAALACSYALDCAA